MIDISFTARPLYPQGKNPPCTHWILGRVAHSVSGRCGEEENLFSFCGNRTPADQPVARRCPYWAVTQSAGCRTFRLHKFRGNSWLTEKPSASHEGVCFIRLASYERSAWQIEKSVTKWLELRILEVPVSDLDRRPVILTNISCLSSVLELDDPSSFTAKQDFLFFTTSSAALGPIRPPAQWVSCAPPELEWSVREIDNSPLSYAEVMNGGATPTTPHTSLCLNA
jgi:hypothetical protein